MLFKRETVNQLDEAKQELSLRMLLCINCIRLVQISAVKAGENNRTPTVSSFIQVKLKF